MKIAEIGPYPPPDTGWSVRIKKLKTCFEEHGHDCIVLNTGKNRKEKSHEYMDVQNGFDYVIKLIYLKLKGYRFHIHTNAQAVKGPILCLAAHFISLLFFQRAYMTFHGGYKQLYFPKQHGKKMYGIIFLNFFLSKKIICNDETIKRYISDYGIFITIKKIFPIQAFSCQYMEYNKISLPKQIENYLHGKKYIIISYVALRNGFNLDTLTEYINISPDQTGIVIVGAGKVEDKEIIPLYDKLLELEKNHKVVLIDTLNHDGFLTLMDRADIYLRTPDSDGVSASVLEALASGTVVVACDNGRRPEGVVTYRADDVKDMQEKIESVLEHLEYYKSAMIKSEILDTVKQEMEVLIT